VLAQVNKYGENSSSVHTTSFWCTLHHIVISCVLPWTWRVSWLFMVLQSTSMWPCVTYLVDCFT